MTVAQSEAATNPRELSLRACSLLVLLFGIAIRGLLVWHGRMTVLDSFYLNAAARLAEGDTPYHDFTHVAFPLIEAFYALVFRFADDVWRAASATTAIAAIGTALLLTNTLHRSLGAWPSIVAGMAYLIAGPLVAYHAFEREVWTNLGLAAALWLVTRPSAPTTASMAIGLGSLLALTVLFKLTAIVGAFAALIYTWRRRGLEAALLAATYCALILVAATLLCFARYGAEFGTQVFVFFFFKGEAGGIAERASTFLRAIDPTLALGALGLLFARAAARPAGEPFTLLFCAWFAYYGMLSPSYWDHNAIDLTLPAAAGCGMLAAHLIARRPWRVVDRALVTASLVVVVLATHLLEDEESRWDGTPFGLGLDVGYIVRPEAAALAELTPPGATIVVPNPLVAVLAHRRAFVSDFELEPVARGVLQEIRVRGFETAMARRRDGISLGAPESRATTPTSRGTLFEQRVMGNTLLHIVPRWLDAVRHREIAAVVSGPLPKEFEDVHTTAGYSPLVEPRAPTLTGWIRLGP